MKLGFIAIGLALLGCTAGKTGLPNAGSKITIYYNNDNFGYLEPCGCRVTPIGGMDRRWNGMTKTPESARLFVDAGNLFFKTKSAPQYLSQQWFEQAVGVVEAYNLLKADALQPGENDFALGIEEFKKLQAKANFPFVSANIIDKATGKPLLKPYTIVERNGWKIGIFGVIGKGMQLPAELEIRDPKSAANDAIKELRRAGADMIIALSHQGYEQDQEFAKGVSGIHLIVGASTQSLLQKPDRVGSTDIVQLSNQGQMLGVMEYEKTGQQINLAQSRVDELNSDYDKGPNPDLPNPMKSLTEVTNIRIGQANRALDEKLWDAHKADSAQGYQTFLNCRSCHTTQAHFQDGLPHAAAMLTLMAHKKERNLDCVKCHSVGLGEANGFSHLGESLLRKDGSHVDPSAALKAAGLEKIVGTETNYRANKGNIRPDVARWIEGLKKLKVEKAFVGVQCENCHGPRPDHPFGIGSGSPGKVLTSRCLSCHTKEQMPSWYDQNGKVKQEALSSALKSVACPK